MPDTRLEWICSCLSAKEFLARNKFDIWKLSGCNETRTHNHLVCKRTLSHLAKLARLLSLFNSKYLLCMQCCNLYSHSYLLFKYDRKCLKIIAFSRRDGLKMNGSGIGLGKKDDTVAISNYCSKDTSVANMRGAALKSHMKGKKHVKRSPSDQPIKSLMPPTPAPSLIILKISLSGV